MYKLIDHRDRGTWEKEVSKLVTGICDNYSHNLTNWILHTSLANFADVPLLEEDDDDEVLVLVLEVSLE